LSKRKKRKTSILHKLDGGEEKEIGAAWLHQRYEGTQEKKKGGRKRWIECSCSKGTTTSDYLLVERKKQASSSCCLDGEEKKKEKKSKVHDCDGVQ